MTVRARGAGDWSLHAGSSCHPFRLPNTKDTERDTEKRGSFGLHKMPPRPARGRGGNAPRPTAFAYYATDMERDE